MMKLPPKQYKNISDKEKYDIKFAYEHDKARRELMEERINEIKNMTAIEYLNTLNEETKQKLIGLCLNKKMLELFESDEVTNEVDNEKVEHNSDDDFGEEEEEDMEDSD